MQRFTLFTALALSFAPLATLAQSPARVTATGKNYGNYARVMLPAGEPVRVETHRSGTTLTLQFDRPLSIDFSSVTASLSPYIRSARMGANGKSATLELKAPYDVRHFTTANAGGFDVMTGSVAPTAKTNAAAAKKVTAATPAPAASTASPKPKPSPMPVPKAPLPAAGKVPTDAPGKATISGTANAANEASKSTAGRQTAATQKAAPPAATADDPFANLPSRYVPSVGPEVAAPAAAPSTMPKRAKVTPPPKLLSKPLPLLAKENAPAAKTPASLLKPTVTTETAPETPPIVENDGATSSPTKETATPLPPPLPEAIKQAAAEARKAQEAAKANAPAPPVDTAEPAPNAASEEVSTAATSASEPAPPASAKPHAEPVEKAASPAEAFGTPLPLSKPALPTVNGSDTATADATDAATDATKPAAPPDLSKNPVKQDEKAPANPVTGQQQGSLVVAVDARKVSADLRFPWKERAASAVFMLNRDLYILFNKESRIDIPRLKTILPSFIESVEQIPTPGNTVLRLRGTTEFFARTRKNKENYEWIVTLTHRSNIPPTPIVPAPGIESSYKPNIMLPILETADPIQVKDSVSGLPLVVVPIYRDGVGILPRRDFLDVTFLRTSQGVAMIKKNPALRVSRTFNGVRVSAPQGLVMTSHMEALSLKDYVSAESGATFFPYANWKSEDLATYTRREHELLREITEASAEKAAFKRLSLAQHYFGDGRYLEAIAVLNLIRETQPNIYNNYQLAALHGAASFMVHRYEEAAADFADGALAGEDEIVFWKQITDVLLNNTQESIRYKDFNKQYLVNYAPDIRREIALIAADQMVNKQRYNAALEILNGLAEAKLLAPVKDYADMIMARTFLDNAKFDDARKSLNRLVKSKHRFIRASAEYYLASLDYQEQKIDRKQLIERLDKLRLIWRGDSLEPTVLNQLAALSIEEKDYMTALRAWRELMRHYPKNPNAQKAYALMTQTFGELFIDGKADSMKPLEALALYYEFRDLTPVDGRGDKMIQNLADRLAGVDLLDRAAALLEHQVTYRLDQAERSRVGARLAMIYLLNRQPKLAVDALERTDYGSNTPSLAEQRAHIAATAYAQLGQAPVALSMLKNDRTMEANGIRMDIFWESKDWKNVIATGEAMLARRTDITAPLTQNETQTLLRLAIAYAFTQDTLQLQYLHDYFTPLIQDKKQKEAFAFITTNAQALDNRNIAELSQQLADVQHFIQNYRDRVAEQGLSNAVN